MSEKPSEPTKGWCLYCGARDPEYCKGGDEQGRCCFHDNPRSKRQLGETTKVEIERRSVAT